MNIFVVLDQFVDNNLTDMRSTSNIVKYPDMLIKLIYISHFYEDYMVSPFIKAKNLLAVS